MRYLIYAFVGWSLSVSAQDPYKNIYSAHAWKERDQWQKASALIDLMRVGIGAQVADIGCHEGYMSYKLSRAVGQEGKVFAVDVDVSKLDKLKKSITENGITNITVIKGEYDDPRLPDKLLDAVIILDTYHEMDDHDKVLQHVFQALKPDGRLLICEPIADSRRKLKRSEQESRHEIGLDFVLADLKRTGFSIEVQRDPYIDRTKQKGDKMWVIVAIKK